MTDRVRITGGPWPERIGLMAVVLAAPKNAGRPFNTLAPGEVVLFIPNDAAAVTSGGVTVAPKTDYSQAGPWSCVILRQHVEPAGL